MKANLIAVLLVVLPNAASAHGEVKAPSVGINIKTPIVKAGGGQIGELSLTQGTKGVLLRLEAAGLTPGWHAMHFHAVGDCSDSTFQKSGAHVNHSPKPSPHGLLNPAGPDFGDLPNFYVAADGVGRAEAFSTLVQLGGGAANLLDADGSALVIHAASDDHVSQPIGGAGARSACAVIKRP